LSSTLLTAPERTTPTRIMELSWGLARTATLVAGLDLDIFSHIDAGHDTTDALVTVTGASPRGVEALLNGLAATGLIIRGSDGTYELARDAATFLVRGGPAYLGDLRHVHHDLNYRIWPTLTEVVATGEPVREVFAADGSATWRKITPYLDALAVASARALTEALRARLPQPPRVLDVGCGSGGYDRMLTALWPGTCVVGVDRPGVVAIAAELAENAGCADSVTYLGGDLRDIDWDGTYDVVLLSNVLHGYAAADCSAFLRRARLALAPGGLLVIHEVVPDLDNSSPSSVTAFFGLQMLMTSDGTAHRLEDYRGWLSANGFDPPEVLHDDARPMSLILSTVTADQEG